MINNDKWLDSIPKTDLKNSNDIHQLDHSRWEQTIPKKNTFNSVKKYSLMSFMFVCGLLLVSAVKNETKRRKNNYKKNPATKTFQAIRIFVNRELTELMSGLIQAAKILSKGGILIVVSFHSLEDKIVKNFFNLYSNLKKNPSRYLPINESKSSLFKLISKKPLVPDTNEINKNIRSRSAKLRYAIRNDNTFIYPEEFKNKFINYYKLEEGRI